MAVTQQMLTDAQEAYHALLIGESVAEFRDQNGEIVKYTPANRNALASYIARLEKALGIGQVPGSSRPMQVWF